MDSIVGIKQSFELAKHLKISLTGVKSYASYEDVGFFFDHVLELEDCYVNFCQITDLNRGRYLLLEQLNEQLSTNHFVKSEINIFKYGDTEWFYERIPKFAPLRITPASLVELWQDLIELNKEANAIAVSNDIIQANNQFFKKINYYNELTDYFPSKASEHDLKLNGLYSNYADLEKTMELNRITYDTRFKVTGLQSFLPCPFDYTKIVSVIYSSMFDSNIDLDIKLRLLDKNSPVIKIINSIKEQISTYPKYYKIDLNTLVFHLDRIERTWQELQ